LGPCPWWSEGASAARYALDGGDPLPAAVLFGPSVGARVTSVAPDDGAAVARARERAGPGILRRVGGVLTLLGVEAVDDRTGWVYEDFDGVSLTAVLSNESLPQRVGAELVARCAEVLEPLTADGAVHPGLGAEDVLVRADGDVRIAGFVGRSPGRRSTAIHAGPRTRARSCGASGCCWPRSSPAVRRRRRPIGSRTS
ncbi:MAG: hypothetical protein ABMB14_21900, partial [Myxococcota bacterium]